MSTANKIRFFIFFFSISLTADGKDWSNFSQVNFGFNVNLYRSPGQHFPGFRAYCAFVVNNTYQEHFITNYAATLAIYKKSLGNNLNPLIDDLQIDFTNSVSAGYGSDEVAYVKYFRTIHTAPYYNAMLKNNIAGLLTTNFVFNNHHRNQATGAISGTFNKVSLYYMNDGAAPMSTFGIADGFDRWWTGSGGLFFHNKEGFNDVEFLFDQFTGYIPLLYELSGIIGINVPSYNLSEKSSIKESRKSLPAFNASSYTLRYFPSKGFGIETGVLGSLKCNSGRFWGVQELIHYRMGYSFHPNYTTNRFFMGAIYNNMNDVR